ncbi:MAG: LysM peptidoglycan-binding domain-containing protein [Bacteroidaceae bacterium]|nr:LysM peptidoglycan-binding domain-containing protein [Bacteroidaceae bacterium]
MKKFAHIILLSVMLAFTLSAAAQNNEYFIHTVSKGQTLYSISRMYGTTVKEIIDLNPGSATKIDIGQQLKIRQSHTAENREQDNVGAIFHTIKSGETLYRLGQMYQITPQEICAANPGLSISNFRSGEVIMIPKRKEQVPDTARQDNKEQKTEQQKENKTIEARGIRTTHKVERKETIYSIARKYGITEEQLKKANPQEELHKKKLKKNTILNIPYPDKNIASIVQQDSNKAPEEKSNAEIFRQLDELRDAISDRGPFEGIKVAVILPFLLDSYSPNEQARMVEYYEGFLLAVKKLKDEGYSFEINTYDSGKEHNSLLPLLNSGELDEMDIIIGALYPSHNKQLAKFAKEKNIPLVIPFTSKEDEIFRNPMVYVVNTIQSYFFPEVIDHFFQEFPSPNVIFVSDGTDGKKEFVDALKERLDRENAPYTTLPLTAFSNPEMKQDSLLTILNDTLTTMLVEDKQNLFIPTSASETTLATVLPVLHLVNNNDSITHPKFNLFGYPEWQIYASNMGSQIYEVDTYFYASFFSHPTLIETSLFRNDYIRWYNRNIQNTYPRYSMLGYDTGYTFLSAISKYGTDMPEKINELPSVPVQTGFKFERVNNWGGLVNKKIYFVRYKPDFLIDKIDFDKR